MKFAILSLLLALSPASVLGGEAGNTALSGEQILQNKIQSVSASAGPCAAPEKMLRWSCVKNPATSASVSSSGSDTVERGVSRPKVLGRTDLKRTYIQGRFGQGKPEKVLKPVHPVKIVKTTEQDAKSSARHKPSTSFKV